MEIGELRHRITFQKLMTTTNENGFDLEDWVDIKTVWSAARNLNGKEFFEAAMGQAEKTVKFIIRFTDGIDETMRILFKQRIYNITFIDNIKYRNNFIEIKALEVESCG